MSEKRTSEEHARFIIKQYKRTEVGRKAAEWLDRSYDTDFLNDIDELRLIEAFIDGFGCGFADARGITLETKVQS